jgi:hypothetical protein
MDIGQPNELITVVPLKAPVEHKLTDLDRLIADMLQK